MLALQYLATTSVAGGAAALAYGRTRDALHPAVLIGPLMAGGYGLWPLILNREGDLLRFFHPEQLESVAFLYFLAVSLFFTGMLWGRRTPGRGSAVAPYFSGMLQDAGTRRRLFHVALPLGLVAVAAYWHMLDNAGGFVHAFSRPKGGGWAESGYIGEAALLAFPAVGLLALSRFRQRIRGIDVLLALVFVSPHLLQGTFGGRRGPLFLALAMLFFAWYLARGKVPSLRTGLIAGCVIVLTVLLAWSQRQHVYLGSDGWFDASRLSELVTPEQVSVGNEYVSGVATVLAADHHQDFFWGYRYFVTFVIRPIPRQLWPTKYEDMGATWLDLAAPDVRQRYVEAVGFAPVGGASFGLVADLYAEFAWGMLIVVLLLGRCYGWLWERHRVRSGLWSVLYLELIILSIYLPVQSFSAVMHRFLFMSIITVLVWRYWIDRTHPSRPETIRSDGWTPRLPVTER